MYALNSVFPKELPESSNVQETSSDTLPEKSSAMRQVVLWAKEASGVMS